MDAYGEGEAGGSPVDIQGLLERHGHQGHRLVQMLQEVQCQAGWIAPAVVEALAQGTGRSRADVQATAESYRFLHTRPVGRYRVLFSDNITDRMAGSQALMQRLCHRLWVEPGQMSEDGLLSVDTTSCTGLCDQGPALLVNQQAIPRLTPERIDAIADLIQRRVPLADWPADWFVVEHTVRRAGPLLGSPWVPGAVRQRAQAMGAEAVCAEIEASGLRGRGGAGYPTGLKWRHCREAVGTAHYVVCNADEGEPGTFKDRVLLATACDQVLDGMGLVALVTGARQGLIYLRAEYRFLWSHVQSRLAEHRRQGWLGPDALGPGQPFDIEVHLGAGAYVCGEETALIESLEGRPARPRLRPPFPVTHGYLGQPTVVNNVETLAQAALVIAQGAAVWRRTGTAESPGSKLFSVSGDVERPGVYEQPFGITLEQLLAEAGARSVQAVTTAGAAGHCLPATALGRRLCHEDVPSGGSIMVLDQRRDLFELVRQCASFFAHESCGFCTPCRVGTAMAQRLWSKLAQGRGSAHDLSELERLHGVVSATSHCGLGQSATLLWHDVLQYFRPQMARHLTGSAFEPGFDLDAALARTRQATGRDDPDAHLGSNAAAGL